MLSENARTYGRYASMMFRNVYEYIGLQTYIAIADQYHAVLITIEVSNIGFDSFLYSIVCKFLFIVQKEILILKDTHQSGSIRG